MWQVLCTMFVPHSNLFLTYSNSVSQTLEKQQTGDLDCYPSAWWLCLVLCFCGPQYSFHCPRKYVYLAEFNVSLFTSCISSSLMEILAHIFKPLYQPQTFIEEWLAYYLE